MWMTRKLQTNRLIQDSQHFSSPTAFGAGCPTFRHQISEFMMITEML
jgi:hypothetical protein